MYQSLTALVFDSNDVAALHPALQAIIGLLLVGAFALAVHAYWNGNIRYKDLTVGRQPSLSKQGEAARDSAADIHPMLPLTPQEEQSTRSVIDLNGTWEMRDWSHHKACNFTTEDERLKNIELQRTRKHDDQARITQTNRTVVATFKHPDTDGELTRYELKGTLTGNFLTGVWYEKSPAKSTVWRGSFQFFLIHHRDGNRMLGRWVGSSRDEKSVGCGVWEWRQRKDPDRPPSVEWPSEDHEFKDRAH